MSTTLTDTDIPRIATGTETGKAAGDGGAREPQLSARLESSGWVPFAAEVVGIQALVGCLQAVIRQEGYDNSVPGLDGSDFERRLEAMLRALQEATDHAWRRASGESDSASVAAMPAAAGRVENGAAKWPAERRRSLSGDVVEGRAFDFAVQFAKLQVVFDQLADTEDLQRKTLARVGIDLAAAGKKAAMEFSGDLVVAEQIKGQRGPGAPASVAAPQAKAFVEVDLAEVEQGLENLGCRFEELVAQLAAMRDWTHDDGLFEALLTGAGRLAEAGQERAGELVDQIVRVRQTEQAAAGCAS